MLVLGPSSRLKLPGAYRDALREPFFCRLSCIESGLVRLIMPATEVALGSVEAAWHINVELLLSLRSTITQVDVFRAATFTVCMAVG